MDVVKLLGILTDCREGKRKLEYHASKDTFILLDITDQKYFDVVYNNSPEGFITDLLDSFGANLGR